MERVLARLELDWNSKKIDSFHHYYPQLSSLITYALMKEETNDELDDFPHDIVKVSPQKNSIYQGHRRFYQCTVGNNGFGGKKQLTTMKKKRNIFHLKMALFSLKNAHCVKAGKSGLIMFEQFFNEDHVSLCEFCWLFKISRFITLLMIQLKD